MRRKWLWAGCMLVLVTLPACRGIGGLLGRDVGGTPAPTAIPLPSATFTPEASATPAPTAAATAAPLPTSTPTSPAPDPTATAAAPTATSFPSPAPSETPAALATEPSSTAATRVVPPAERVNLPPGFGISVYRDGLRDPRMMTLGPGGEIYVAERGAGRIVRLPDGDRDGVADGVEEAAGSLTAPSSIAFYRDGSLYVGEPGRVLRLFGWDGALFRSREVVVDGLPTGGHNTRTLLFSPDGEWLYVSVGSSCNVCDESDERRAAIVRYRPDGSDEQIYARGLRNAVGIVFRPGTDELWATNNGRDMMGDDQPPETVYVVSEGDDAGWPRCHSGRIVDPDMGQEGDCEGVLPPVVEMQAHSAPLGLTFYTGDAFPPEYRGSLFVAYHGSWNRTVPTGYKVVRIPVVDGAAGPVYDFSVGWLRENGSNWGRPVDVLTGSDGALYISDDKGGIIYRVFYRGGAD